MFTSKPLGLLTVQIPDEQNKYTLVAQSSMPLKDGGFLFAGVISPVDDDRSAEIIIHVQEQLLKHVYTKKISETQYEFGIGLPVPAKLFEMTIHTNSSDTQSFYGSVKNLVTEKTYKFSYTDLNEPLTIGGVVIILAGIAAICCALVDIIGLIANWRCKKVEVTYGISFSWKEKDLKVGCHVKCLDKDDKE